MTTPTTPLLELHGVTKSFGAVAALVGADLTLDAGSIHALIGENGAGKSTLVKIIGGLYRRDAGEFLLEGQSVDFHSTREAKDAGIAVIYQEPTLFPDLSVAENMFVGHQPYTRFGTLDRAKMRRETRELTSGEPLQVADGALTLVEVLPERRAGERPDAREPYRFGFTFAGGL